MTQKVVMLSGGTGGEVTAEALVDYVKDIEVTAVTTAFDSGGSTGVLAKKFGWLPQGDIRRILTSLVEKEQREALKSSFEYRSFPEGHPIGNILLLMAEKMWGRERGIEELKKLLSLNTKGEVLPVSLDTARLCAVLSDDTELIGESVIDTRNPFDKRTIQRVWLDGAPRPYTKVLQAINTADYIIVSPSDLITSQLSIGLVDGIASAINDSKATIIYIATIMTKPSETRGFSVMDTLDMLHQYCFTRGVDYVLVNTQKIPEEQCVYYAQKTGASPMLTGNTHKAPRSKMPTICGAKLLSDVYLKQNLIRHDAKKLGRAINILIQKRP